MTDVVERLAAMVEGAGLPWRADLCDIVRDDPNDDDPRTVAHCGTGEGVEVTIVTVVNAVPVLLATITSLRAERDALRDFAKWASLQYENQNLGHGDFRVEAKARADDALAGRINHA